MRQSWLTWLALLVLHQHEPSWGAGAHAESRRELLQDENIVIRHADPDKPFRVLGVTAYYDIGRGGWQGGFKRTNKDYIKWFRYLLSSGMTEQMDMVCFCEHDMCSQIHAATHFYNTIVPDLNDTFMKFMREEQATMDSPDFKRLVQQQLATQAGLGGKPVPEMVGEISVAEEATPLIFLHLPRRLIRGTR